MPYINFNLDSNNNLHQIFAESIKICEERNPKDDILSNFRCVENFDIHTYQYLLARTSDKANKLHKNSDKDKLRKNLIDLIIFSSLTILAIEENSQHIIENGAGKLNLKPANFNKLAKQTAENINEMADYWLQLAEQKKISLTSNQIQYLTQLTKETQK